jgi:hypothetical protein
MMLRSALLAAALSAAACAAPAAVETPVAEPANVGPIPSGACEVKVDFASIGTGIDSAALEKVDAVVSGDKGVSTVDRQRWGKEGEITLCIDTLTGGDADRLFGAIKAVFPASSQKPISVETAGGQHYRVPTP